MNIESIKKERQKWLEWKNIAPLRQLLAKIPKVECEVELGDVIRVDGEIDEETKRVVEEAAWAMRPWRKGPFELFGTFIDSEWRSYIKYNLLEPHFDLRGKDLADIGCNNGYYLFRMLSHSPASLTGFDPSPLFKTQFDLIDRFVQSSITYELLGVEHLPLYPKRFDTIFCLGVLYHRSDPVATLKWLRQGLKKGGELFLDTFYIEGEEPVALCPAKTYSKIPNVHFVPTILALRNWCESAGLEEFEVLATKPTTFEEQRKTKWIEGQSLEDFLDPKDPTRTIEGYPAPRRVYVKLRRP